MSVSYKADHLRVRCGVVKPPQDKQFTVTVNAHDIDIFNVTEDDIKYLDGIMLEDSENNTKGKEIKKRKVTDTVENSKYTKTFDTNIDLESILKKMGMKGYIKPYKMNLYKEGTSYRCDKLPESLMGTLMLTLPTPHTGGEFVFSTFNVERKLPKDKLRFIYFEHGLEHSGNKVLSGNRITLAYNVFYNKKCDSDMVYPEIELSSIPFKLNKELLHEAIEFCKDKKNLLLGSCKYNNKMFIKLKNGLQNLYNIIEVSVEEGGDIAHITQVHEIDEGEEAEVYYQQDGDEFGDYILKTHKVHHILFPDSSEVSDRREMVKISHEDDYIIKFFRCYLINPDMEAAQWAKTRLAYRVRREN